MGLFNFKMKKKEVKGCCCSGGCCNTQDSTKQEVESNIKVLGSGCAKCDELETSVIEALKELSIDTSVEHITDFSKIAEYGVMTTPALVINNKVVSMGKVLKKDEVIQILKENK